MKAASVLIALIAAASLRAAPAPSSDIVVMQQLIVRDTRIHQDPWLYVALPDYEIISHSSREDTLREAGAIERQLAIEKQKIIPPAYWPALATPMSLILIDEKPPSTGGSTAPPLAVGKDQPYFGPLFVPFVNWTDGCLDVSDADTQAIMENRWKTEADDPTVATFEPTNSGMEALQFEEDIQEGLMAMLKGDYVPDGMLGSGPVPAGIHFTISQCVPALPFWYRLGLAGQSRLDRIRSAGSVPPNTGTYGAIVASALWISDAATDQVLAAARKSHGLPSLPPIEELFRQKGVTEQDFSPALRAEAALFLRWGLFEQEWRTRSHLKAFIAFRDRSRTEPITEAMFRECFGFGYGEMQLRLSRYFKKAVTSPMALDYGPIDNGPAVAPALKVREATPDEVGRILGDWMRMKGNSLRATDPEASQQYFASAGRILERFYKEGNSQAHDPSLLAVYGMYEHDVGDEAKAREFLAAAVKSGVARPAAYVDLAQINLTEARTHPAAAGGKFSAQQTAAVLAPLFAVNDRARIGPAGYLLIAQAWSQSLSRPSLANLAVLDRGLYQFPFDSSLRLAVAKVCAQWGYTAQAQAVISHGLKFADNDTAKQLATLQTSLGSGAR